MNEIDYECVDVPNGLYIGSLLILSVFILINVFFSISMIKSFKRVLKLNIIYVYVANGLFGNILYCAVQIYFQSMKLIAMENTSHGVQGEKIPAILKGK